MSCWVKNREATEPSPVYYSLFMGLTCFPGGPVVKNPSASAGEVRGAGSIPKSGRSPGGGHGNPLQCSCLENPMNRGAWQATVHRVTKSWARMKRVSLHACSWGA